MSENQKFEIDLMEAIKYVWEKKIIVMVITIFFISLLIGISFLVTPIFQVQTVLAPISSGMSKNNIANKLGGLVDIVGIGGAGSADESTIHMAVFESRKFTRDLIQENNLKPILFSKQWDSTLLKWKGEEPSLWFAVNYFAANVRTITVNQETGLVTLKINWHDPKMGVIWADLIVKRINKALHDEFLHETHRNLNYLNEQLLKTQNSEMRSVIFALIQEQVKKEMLSSDPTNYAYKIVDPAVVPEKKSSPKRSLYAIMGMLIGGIIGVGYAWVVGTKGRQVSRKNTL